MNILEQNEFEDEQFVNDFFEKWSLKRSGTTERNFQLYFEDVDGRI